MATDNQDTGSTGNAPQDAEHEANRVAEGELSSEQILERAVLYALDQGREMLEQSGEFEPFTVLIDGEELYIEEHPAESEEESYASARRTVYQMERVCSAYAFCYDGYVDLEDGTSDALVVEFANKGDKQAQIIVLTYHRHDDHYHFNDTLYQVGETDTLFGGTPEGSPGDDADADGGAGAEDGAYTDDDGDADTDGATGAEGDPADAPHNRKSGKSSAADPTSDASYGIADVAITAADVAAGTAAGVGRTAGKLGLESAVDAILDGLL
jgi:hypothetical protein